MITYEVTLYRPSGGTDPVRVNAERVSVESSNGRTWLHFWTQGSLTHTLVVGQGVSYLLYGVDEKGENAHLPR